MAPTQDFRLLDGWGKMVTPLGGKGFEVRSLPRGEMRPLEHEWAVGTRLGPPAAALASHWLKAPPPALHRASPWEVLPGALHSGQVGRPPTARTDVSLGCSVAGHCDIQALRGGQLFPGASCESGAQQPRGLEAKSGTARGSRVSHLLCDPRPHPGASAGLNR